MAHASEALTPSASQLIFNGNLFSAIFTNIKLCNFVAKFKIVILSFQELVPAPEWRKFAVKLQRYEKK